MYLVPKVTWWRYNFCEGPGAALRWTLRNRGPSRGASATHNAEDTSSRRVKFAEPKRTTMWDWTHVYIDPATCCFFNHVFSKNDFEKRFLFFKGLILKNVFHFIKVCQFPFKYKGRVYDKCTYTEHHALWCATSVNAYGELIYWGKTKNGFSNHVFTRRKTFSKPRVHFEKTCSNHVFISRKQNVFQTTCDLSFPRKLRWGIMLGWCRGRKLWRSRSWDDDGERRMANGFRGEFRPCGWHQGEGRQKHVLNSVGIITEVPRTSIYIAEISG